jgi:RNA-directed DNA polymerase
MELIQEVVRRENMLAAHRRVVKNDGAPGVDGMTVDDLEGYVAQHWTRVRDELLSGTYQPQPVRRVEIPKPDGRGMRMLGIPTVLDRLIQQALLQVLTPIFEPTFSDGSFGFRPGRSTHGAILRAREHVAAGFQWCVDFDLEKFFDRVNHDVLMARVARRVKDKRVLLLIRRYLQAGLMEGGVVSPRVEGTPQGGPLSPLLSNVLLDELDKELELRGHKFVRYADDCNVYVRSQASGERVMESLERFLAKRLRLKINREKSAVARPWERKFLGYTITMQGAGLKVSDWALERLKVKLQTVFRHGRGRSLAATVKELGPKIRGWTSHFRHVTEEAIFRTLDGRTARHLRAIVWRQWKVPRTRQRELIRRGVPQWMAKKTAYGSHGPWRCANSHAMKLAVPGKELRRLGLVKFLETYRDLARRA